MATAQTRSFELPDAESLRSVRRTTLAYFTEAASLLGRPLRPQLVEAVLIVVSELVGNARRHAPGPCTLRLRADESELDIAVSDTSPRLPRAHAPDLSGVRGGWGLRVVTELAGEVRVRPGPGAGKTVCARLRW
ncbi:ATP-binding protein [Streptomyces sp. NPDC127084]|uniref:ATP-binding protein n=1 Tax=Streptomyces sp. NPDC127084 TaxID=3347133 RepID=UPI003653E54E